MRRVDRVEKELKEIITTGLHMLQRQMQSTGDPTTDRLERPWLDISDLKKFEDVSWAREQYRQMVLQPAQAFFANLNALMWLHESRANFREPPRPGRRKI